MTEREFFKRISNNKKDFLDEFFKILKKKKTQFCIIGGLAVNAYAEPVVSLDVDIVISQDKLEGILMELKKHFKIKKFERSINVYEKDSDLRIQIQTDKIYQGFIKHSRIKHVLGYNLPVAAIEDVFKGKILAYSDKTRRESKRQKDLADIIRLIETESKLKALLPENLKKHWNMNKSAAVHKTHK